MKLKILIFISIVFISCKSDDDISSDVANTSLSNYLNGRMFTEDAVIACAASDENASNSLNIYFYPEEGATNFRLYQTGVSNVNSNNFSKYSINNSLDTPLFGGTLRQFEIQASKEQWFIVTYEVNNTIKICTPIRTKNVLQPTIWSDEISITNNELMMPFFDWEVESLDNNAIFFEVVSKSDNTLLSGTYTFESEFQYYNLENVVLNITVNNPPQLIANEEYQITVMDVSEDNWVNVVIQKQFMVN